MYKITRTQIKWIVMALEHYINETKAQMEAEPDNDFIQDIGEVTVQGREHLKNKMLEIMNSKAKVIKIDN